MEQLVNIHIEKLPEGVYLATSDEIQGLVAQGRTLAETLEIARDVARKLLALYLIVMLLVATRFGLIQQPDTTPLFLIIRAKCQKGHYVRF